MTTNPDPDPLTFTREELNLLRAALTVYEMENDWREDMNWTQIRHLHIKLKALGKRAHRAP